MVKYSSTPKIINPQTFPLDAQGLHETVAEKFRLNQRKHWFYTNEKGEAVFVVYGLILINQIILEGPKYIIQVRLIMANLVINLCGQN